jgi:hypothetical protein
MMWGRVDILVWDRDWWRACDHDVGWIHWCGTETGGGYVTMMWGGHICLGHRLVEGM